MTTYEVPEGLPEGVPQLRIPDFLTRGHEETHIPEPIVPEVIEQTEPARPAAAPQLHVPSSAPAVESVNVEERAVVARSLSMAEREEAAHRTAQNIRQRITNNKQLHTASVERNAEEYAALTKLWKTSNGESVYATENARNRLLELLERLWPEVGRAQDWVLQCIDTKVTATNKWEDARTAVRGFEGYYSLKNEEATEAAHQIRKLIKESAYHESRKMEFLRPSSDGHRTPEFDDKDFDMYIHPHNGVDFQNFQPPRNWDVHLLKNFAVSFIETDLKPALARKKTEWHEKQNAASLEATMTQTALDDARLEEQAAREGYLAAERQLESAMLQLEQLERQLIALEAQAYDIPDPDERSAVEIAGEEAKQRRLQRQHDEMLASTKHVFVSGNPELRQRGGDRFAVSAYNPRAIEQSPPVRERHTEAKEQKGWLGRLARRFSN